MAKYSITLFAALTVSTAGSTGSIAQDMPTNPAQCETLTRPFIDPETYQPMDGLGKLVNALSQACEQSKFDEAKRIYEELKKASGQ